MQGVCRLLLFALVLSAVATATDASGCGPNCDKCGTWRDPFGTKQCRSCCWGDPVQDLGNAASKASCDVVASAGGRAYVAAAGEMSNRAGSAEKFTDDEKALLRPCYSDLVDVANLYFGVPPTDSINIGVAGLKLRNPGSLAQTFGGRIYFKESRSAVDLSLMAHEMMHVQQWNKHGRDLGTMGEKYMRGWCNAGFNYERNAYEAEAFSGENKCSGQKIILKNGCSKEKMLVAIRYSVKGDWKNRGFWTLAPGETVHAATTDNTYIYPWARLVDWSKVWVGDTCYELYGDPKICGKQVATNGYPRTYTYTFSC